MSPRTDASTAADLGIRPRDLDQLCADTIRMLAIDMVNAANSGHPGMPMGCADMAHVLWTRFLRYDPGASGWRDRDRFVLSAGHGSALLYAMLHLSGYDLPMSELQNFRQMGSRTPGHPEAGVTEGVEVTTGPLGAGFANGVGIALAQRMLAERFNAPDYPVTTHRTFAIVSDGDLMEGVAAEAASLAGTLGLGNLVYLYDSNSITIDGATDISFSEDVAGRFQAYGWQVLECDGHDHDALAAAIEGALADTARPSLVVCRTIIGKGSPNRGGKSSSHGAAFGPEETALTKAAYGWTDETFVVPSEVYARFAERAEQGAATHAAWVAETERWREEQPQSFSQWERHFDPALPPASELLGMLLSGWEPGKAATRKHSGAVIQRLAALVPNLVGGSADLAGSNCTTIKDAAFIGPARDGGSESMSFAGSNIHYGVREHAMGSIMNGLATHGSFIPFGGTFLGFLDYMRPPVRLASLSGHGSIFVYTHDSIGVGEDGPTHQPIEHLWSLRVMPGVTVHRPADGPETAAAWADAVARRDGPTAIILTRQGLPPIERPEGFEATDLLRGGYVAADGTDVILIATGSEMGVAVEAREILAGQGISARVVSMPSVELFDRQDDAYKAAVLPEGPKRVAIEAGRPDGWYRFVGRDGLVLGIEGFGHSAPAADIFDHLGLTGPKVAESVAAWMKG